MSLHARPNPAIVFKPCYVVCWSAAFFITPFEFVSSRLCPSKPLKTIHDFVVTQMNCVKCNRKKIVLVFAFCNPQNSCIVPPPPPPISWPSFMVHSFYCTRYTITWFNISLNPAIKLTPFCQGYDLIIHRQYLIYKW